MPRSTSLHRLVTRHALALTCAVALGGCSDDSGSGDDIDVTPEDAADVDTDDSTDEPADDAADDAPLDGSGVEDADGGDVDADPLDDADATEDVDPLLDVWEPVPRTEPQDGAVDTWDPADTLGEGEARVGRVRDGDRPFTGPEARCEPGDLVLANAQVRACIAGLETPSQYTYTGGYLIDIAPAEDTSGEMLEAVFPGEGLRSIYAESITVVRDGSDGGAAVVRVTGSEAPVAAIGNFVGGLFTGTDLRIETEYRVSPDTPWIEAVTWLRASDPELVRARIEPVDVVVGGDHVRPWARGYGDIVERFGTDADAWFGVSESWTYAIARPALFVGALAPGVLDSDIDPITMTKGVIGPRTEANYTRRYAVGRDTQTAEAALFGELAGDVATLVGAPGGDRRVRVRDADGEEVAVVRLDDTDAARFVGAAGEYTAVAWDDDAAAYPTPFTLPAAEPIALNAPPLGRVQVWLEASDGGDVAPSPGLARFTGPVTREVFLDGTGADVWLPAGTYSVRFSRGFEFTTDTVSNVVVSAGESTDANGAISRSMDTVGWVAGDLHQHQRRSIDSSVENTVRVLSNLAAGADFMGPTDHDAVDDFERIVTDMGVRDLLAVYQGLEVSPIWGHMNTFPASAARSETVPLSSFQDREFVAHNAPTLVARARETGAEVVQVNHPRESSGYFDAAEYDPLLGPDDVDADYWPGGFDSMEVVNSDDDVCEVMRDWFSLINHGLRVTGVGNSDSHGLSDPVGWPRNYMWTDEDDPAALTAAMISESILDGAVSVSGGLFIDFPSGPLPGSEVTHGGGTFTLPVRVQSPVWTSTDRLVVFVNGVERSRIQVDVPDGEDTVDYVGDIELEIDSDASVVVWAESDARHSVAFPGKRVFGFANPVYVDVNGDGWTAPGVSGPDDAPTPSGLVFCTDL